MFIIVFLPFCIEILYTYQKPNNANQAEVFIGTAWACEGIRATKALRQPFQSAYWRRWAARRKSVSLEDDYMSRIDWKFILAIMGILVGSGLIWKVLDLYNESRSPSFVINALDNLDDELIYETTSHFIGVNDPAQIKDYTLNWRLQVLPDYTGDNLYGEVRVQVKNSHGDVFAENKWTNFDKNAKELEISLDPYLFSNEVARVDLHGGFESNILETKTFDIPKAIFDVEIVQASDSSRPLKREKLIIRNSPWYHFTTISAWKGNSIEVYIEGKNLGSPSDFDVVVEVFEITEIPGKMWDPWPQVGYQHKIQKNVGSDESFVVSFTLPEDSGKEFLFEKGRVYLLHTYLLKKQEYIKFSDNNTWDSSAHKWVLGSFGNRLLILP